MEEKKQNNKIRWNSIDAVKGLACIAVVLIHVNFPDPLGMYIKAMARFAVPVFFITSGFFYLAPDFKYTYADRTGKKILHIFELIIKSGILYIVFSVLYFNISDPGWSMMSIIRKKVTAGKIVKFFLTNDPFIYSHLWFLLALVYVYLFSLVLFKKGKRLNMVLYMGIVLILCYSLLQEFGHLLGLQITLGIPGVEDRLCIFNLFIFRALPFFLFGMFIQMKLNSLNKIKWLHNCTILVLAFCGTVFAALEYYWTQEEVQFYLGNIFASLCIMIYASVNPNFGGKILVYLGRKLSLYIYIIHIAVYKIVLLMTDNNQIMTWIMPMVVLLGSMLVAIIIDNSVTVLNKVIK